MGNTEKCKVSMGVCLITVSSVESKLAEIKFGFSHAQEFLWWCFFFNATCAFCTIENYLLPIFWSLNSLMRFGHLHSPSMGLHIIEKLLTTWSALSMICLIGHKSVLFISYLLTAFSSLEEMSRSSEIQNWALSS